MRVSKEKNYINYLIQLTKELPNVLKLMSVRFDGRKNVLLNLIFYFCLEIFAFFSSSFARYRTNQIVDKIYVSYRTHFLMFSFSDISKYANV